jgi:threonine synthase
MHLRIKLAVVRLLENLKRADADAAHVLDQKGFFLSSANSINWGRLAPQIVYYVSAYCDLLNAKRLQMGELMNVCVPTGNFGNIFAAYLAKLMGLPIGKLICASNKNNILTDFLQTGTYDRNRQFHLTMSPSMDILISSNLERLLYFVAGAEQTKAYMESLAATGAYTVSNAVKEKIDSDFCGYYADEEQTAQTIRKYRESGYLMDTHTAVGVCCAEQYLKDSCDVHTPMVVASTASPYKFAADVYTSLGMEAPTDPLLSQELLAKHTGTQIPYPLVGLGERTIRFDKTVESQDILQEVLRFANTQ